MSDCVFIGMYFHILMLKLNFFSEMILPICNLIIMTNMVLQFSGNFVSISKNTVGAGGSYESYCSLFYLIGHMSLVFIYYF